MFRSISWLKMSEEQITICRALRELLRWTVLWPPKGHEFRKSYTLGVQIVAPQLVVLFVGTLCGRHLKIIVEADQPIGEDISVLSVTAEIYLMFMIYLREQRRIACVLRDLSNFGRFGEPRNFQKLNDTLDFYCKIVLWYAAVGISVGAIIRHIEAPICKRRNLHENCGFLLPNSTPTIISWDNNPFIFIGYGVFEFIVIGTFIKTPLVISYQLYELTQHLILRLEHVEELILKCFRCADFAKRRQQFNMCLAYHATIIRDSKRVSDIFADFMFIHLVITAIILASLLYIVLQLNDFGYLPLLLGWVICLFLSCTAGQNILDASLTVGDAAYCSNWYEADVLLQKDLLLLLSRSQKPLYMWAGRFSFLCYPLFIAIMKMSYSFLALYN